MTWVGTPRPRQMPIPAEFPIPSPTPTAQPWAHECWTAGAVQKGTGLRAIIFAPLDGAKFMSPRFYRGKTAPWGIQCGCGCPPCIARFPVFRFCVLFSASHPPINLLISLKNERQKFHDYDPPQKNRPCWNFTEIFLLTFPSFTCYKNVKILGLLKSIGSPYKRSQRLFSPDLGRIGG